MWAPVLGLGFVHQPVHKPGRRLSPAVVAPRVPALGTPNLAAGERIAPGINPINADLADMGADILTPSGATLAVGDPELASMLKEGVGSGDDHVLKLARSERTLTERRPLSLISRRTGEQIAQELGNGLDGLRFRASICMDLEYAGSFGEGELVVRSLRIGPTAVVAVLERDPCCKMLSLDPIPESTTPRSSGRSPKPTATWPASTAPCWKKVRSGKVIRSNW